MVLATCFLLGACRREGPPDNEAVVRDDVSKGAQLYVRHCAMCHQPGGEGVEGAFPPLAGSEWVTGPEGRLVRVVLHGMQGVVRVRGRTYSGFMPGWARQLTDEDVAAISSYVRMNWGNGAGPVSVEVVSAIRAATRGRTRPYTADELMQAEHTEVPRAPGAVHPTPESGSAAAGP
jgi:mono/diheme cytochrome c family protein